MSEPWVSVVIALITAILGGWGTSAIGKFLDRHNIKDTYETSLRKELRDDVIALKEEIEAKTKELDEWKAKAFELMEQKLELRNQLSRLELLIERHNLKEE